MGPALATARGPEAGRVGEPAQGTARGHAWMRGRPHLAHVTQTSPAQDGGPSTDSPGSPHSTVGNRNPNSRRDGRALPERMRRRPPPPLSSGADADVFERANQRPAPPRQPMGSPQGGRGAEPLFEPGRGPGSQDAVLRVSRLRPACAMESAFPGEDSLLQKLRDSHHRFQRHMQQLLEKVRTPTGPPGGAGGREAGGKGENRPGDRG